MPAPFIIFGLPRSRTAWLAHWLTCASGRRVGHDLAVQADNVDQYCGALWSEFVGTAETGAIDGWRLLRRCMPSARMVVVFRPVDEVRASLARQGVVASDAQLAHRWAEMQLLAAEPGVLAVPYGALSYPQACAAIHQHCLPGLKFDWELWTEADRLNVQIDMPARLAQLALRADAIAGLKAEVTQRMTSGQPWVRVGHEPWGDCAAECQALGAQHHGEASISTGPGTMDGVYQLDVDALRRLEGAGMFRVVTARVDSRLVGYCLWTNEINVEAAETKAAVQGPFFVLPEFAPLRLGQRMLNRSRELLAREGVSFMRLHHTTAGRGRRAGALYRRMGAVETKREYTLATALTAPAEPVSAEVPDSLRRAA